MPLKQTYDKCEFFDIRNLCPHRDDSIMKEFIHDITIVAGGIITKLNFNKSDEVNRICNSCDSFKEK